MTQALHILLLAIFLLGNSDRAYGLEPFVIKKSHNGEPIGRYLLIFEDYERHSAIEILEKISEFEQSQEDFPNFKITSGKTWAFVTLINNFDESQTIYLENIYAMTDEIAIYSISGHEVSLMERLGDRIPFANRPIYYRNVVFPIKLEPGQHKFLISVQTEGPNKMPFKVWTASELEKKMGQDNFFLGGGIGFVALMTLYNAFLCVSLRSRTYLFYVLYGISFLFLATPLMGLGGYAIGSVVVQEWLSNWGFLTGVMGTNLFATLFTITFLDLKKKLPKVHKIFVALCLVYFVCLLCVIFQVDYFMMARISNTMSGVSSFSMIIVGAYFVWQRYRPAYFYTTAWSLVLLSGLSLSLNNLGIIPTNFWTTYGVFLGGCCEMILLSFALADRVRVLREMHDQNKERYLNDLIRKDREIQHSYGQLAKVVYPHQIHMMKSGLNLEDTMPVGKAKATVIVFDIVASSKIMSAGKQEFFQKIFSDCYRHMMQEYDSQGYTGGAYRLKELGDGFICSVGFPFLLASPEQRNQTAIDLGLGFVRIFHELSREMMPRESCYCSVGVAEGEVAGFYPASGVREYDLYGEAIVLASRYESMRRVMFPQANNSVIIVQNSVMKEVDLKTQEKFQKVQLDQNSKLRIRDDPNADSLYVGLFDEQSILKSRQAHESTLKIAT